ncbi:MAG: hypothetical protein V1729_02950 [Candidatus Woesearchaeota archaeon]
MNRAGIYEKMGEPVSCEQSRVLAEDEFEFMSENATHQHIRDYATAGLKFLEGDKNRAVRHYNLCRRPNKKKGWVRTALSRDRGYILYAWNKGYLSRDADEQAWTRLREEIFDQTEVQLRKLMRSTQKMTAMVKSRSIDTLVFGGIAAAVMAGIYIATPDLEQLTAEAAPTVQEQVKEEEPESPGVLTPTASWERKGRYVHLVLQYNNGTEIPATQVARMIYYKKERGKKVHKYEFIPQDDVDEFSRKINGRRPVKYWAEIYLAGGNRIETEPIVVK